MRQITPLEHLEQLSINLALPRYKASQLVGNSFKLAGRSLEGNRKTRLWDCIFSILTLVQSLAESIHSLKAMIPGLDSSVTFIVHFFTVASTTFV